MSNYRPYHFIVFSFLFIANHFFQIVDPGTSRTVVGWMANAALAIVICTGLSFAIFRMFRLKFSPAKSAILTILITGPFFFFQDLFLLMEKLVIAGFRARYVFPVLLVLLGFAFYRIIKSSRPLIHLNKYLDVLSISLFGYTLYALVSGFHLPKSWSEKLPEATLTCEVCPNVYFFLLDSYTSNQSLKQYFAYGNDDFTKELQHLGFDVADDTRSRHKHTAYSVSSTLNFDSLPGLEDFESLGPLLNDNAVVKTFQQRGYHINNYSIFKVANIDEFYSLAVPAPGKVLSGIMASSILNIVISDAFLKITLYDKHADVLAKTIAVAETKRGSPQFTYAHLLSPHPPFVMDANGNELPFLSQPGNISNPGAYVEQVKGLNKKLIETLRAIVRNDSSARIILLGDHGYRYLSDPKISEFESFRTFLAYRGKRSVTQLEISNQIFNVVLQDLNQSEQR